MKTLKDVVEVAWAIVSLALSLWFSFALVYTGIQPEVPELSKISLSLTLGLCLGSCLMLAGLPLIDLAEKLIRFARRKWKEVRHGSR